jgi:hypothetical protein
VNLNVDTLKDLLGRLQSFNDAVESLPAELEDIYIRMIQGIASKPQDLQLEAGVILHLVFATARPLRIEEIASLSGLTQRQESDSYVEEDVYRRVVLCNHFLEIHNNCVVLCHSSVRDFRQYWTHDKKWLPTALRICGVEHKIHEYVNDGLDSAFQQARESKNWA